MNHYTGVGSRNTPLKIQRLMAHIALIYAKAGWVLRSGGADGADKAFEDGCDRGHGAKEIYYAHDATPEAMEIAAKYHGAWYRCSGYARKLHGRNAFQVLGRDLRTPSVFQICWTQDACTRHSTRSSKTGGTGTAISIADGAGVVVHNLANPQCLKVWQEFVNKHMPGAGHDALLCRRNTSMIGEAIVINKYKRPAAIDPRQIIYIGRGSVFGNQYPASMGRSECITDYKENYFNPAMKSDTPLRRSVLAIVERLLSGETVYLECSCKPQACHGDVIKDRIDQIVLSYRESGTMATPS